MYIPEQRQSSSVDDEVVDTAENSHETFEELYARHYSTIVGLLRTRGAGSHAEDIAQEAFTKAFTHMDHYSEEGKAVAWLSVIATHAFFDFCRYSKHRPLDFTDDTTILDYAAPTHHTDPSQLAEEAHTYADMHSSIFAALSDSHAREVFLLLAEGYTNSEISEILGMPRSTVGTKILRGRVALNTAGINQ